jgi:hypothetical protein
MRFYAIHISEKYCLSNLLSLWLLHPRVYEVKIVLNGSTELLTTTEIFFSQSHWNYRIFIGVTNQDYFAADSRRVWNIKVVFFEKYKYWLSHTQN